MIASDILVLASTDLRRRFRSRSALVTAFIAPLVLPMLFGLMFSPRSQVFEIGVADDSELAIGAQLTASLTASGDDGDEENDALDLVPVGSGAEARRLVEDGELDSAIVLENTGGQLSLSTVGARDHAIAAQVADSIAYQLAGRIDRQGAAGVEIRSLPVGGRPLSATAYFGAAMAIVFLFFTVSSAAKSLLEERRNRTLDRILAGPTRPAAVVLGKVVSIAALATAGFITVWAVTTVVFDATWGNTGAVLLLIIATVFALCGVALFIASLARSAQQSDSISAVVTFALALLGGNFVGPTDTPELLRKLSKFTPNGWALRGFTEVSVDAASLSSLVGSLSALAAFGAVFGVFGLVRFERLVAGR